MKYNSIKQLIFASVLALFMAMVITPAFGADKIMETPIKQMSVQKDKNGDEYVRFIVTEPQTLSGVTYDKEFVVTGFGADIVLAAQDYKPGDTLKAVVSGSEYQGRTYYNVLQFIE
jgi:hypothetical protein